MYKSNKRNSNTEINQSTSSIKKFLKEKNKYKKKIFK